MISRRRYYTTGLYWWQSPAGVTPAAKRNTYSVATFFYLYPGLRKRNSVRVAKGAHHLLWTTKIHHRAHIIHHTPLQELGRASSSSSNSDRVAKGAHHPLWTNQNPSSGAYHLPQSPTKSRGRLPQAAATLTELPRVRTIHYGLTKTIIGRIPSATLPYKSWGELPQAAATLTELPRVRTIHYGLTKIHHRVHTICHNPLPRAAEGFLKQQQL